MKKYVWRIILACALGLFLGGCAARSVELRAAALAESGSGEKALATFPIAPGELDGRAVITIAARGKVEAGALRYELRDPRGVEVWSPGEFGGEYTVNTSIRPEQAGDYTLWAVWTGASRGTYSLTARAAAITPLVLVPGLGMALVAAAFTVYALRRGGTWKYLALGALAWLATVAVKFAVAIPLNPLVFKALGVSENSALASPGNLLAYLYIGLLTGFTEVLLAWLLLRYTRLGRTTFANALAFGVGAGAFEAFVLGVLNLMGSAVVLAAPQVLPAEATASIALAGDPLYGLAPIVERGATIFCHILARTLLFYAVSRRQARWLWGSFAFLSLLDAVAGFAQFWGLTSPARIWAIEGLIVLFGAAAAWGTHWVRANYPAVELTPTPGGEEPAAGA